MLAVLLQGAEGNTLKQILNALHLTVSDKGAIANQFGKYFSQSASPLLLTANRLYVKNGYQIKNGFKDIITKKFDFDIENVDFSESQASASTINGFVEQKTKNKIKNLIQPSQLNSDTRLVAVNALHFKADWLIRFDKDSTRQGDFYVNWMKSAKVDYMQRERQHYNFAYHKDLDAKVLELEFKTSNLENDYSFVIILPNKRTDLLAFESNLKNYDFKEIVNKVVSKSVRIKIPKFKIEFDLKLNDVLMEVCICIVVISEISFVI